MAYRRLAPQGHSGTLKDVAPAWIQGTAPNLVKAEIRLDLTSPMLETAYCLDRLLELA